MTAHQKIRWVIFSVCSAPSLCLASAQIFINNACYQPVALYASNQITCEPSGIDLARDIETQTLKINADTTITCFPQTDDGQSNYAVYPEQQNSPKESLSPQTYDLPEGGKITFYCSNNGPWGLCACNAWINASNP